MNKVLVLGIVLILLFTINLTLNNSHASLNPVYEIPITITNSQSVATPNPYQQKINLNESNYKGIIIYNGSFANFEFSYSNGTIIPAWIESNISGNLTIWLKLYSINALSSIIIYLDIFPLNDNLLSNSGNTGIGEAPQLSKTYGEYDDGSNVFNFYDNFSGTSLKSSWSSYGSTGSISVNNGLTLSGGNSWWGIKNTYTVSSPSILEYYGEQTQSGGYGPAIGTYTGVYFEQRTADSPSEWGIEQISSGGTSSGSYGGSSSYNTWYLVSGTYFSGSLKLITNYAIIQVSAVYSVGSSNLVLASFRSSTSVYQWVRARAYPPNGIMPSVSFGTLTKLITYYISFKESGLASGIEWSVRLNNSTSVLWQNSTNSYINFTNLVNGNYHYNVYVLNKWYSVNPESGNIFINGNNVTKSITFNKLYSITFIESGLSNTTWNITFNSKYYSSNTSKIIIPYLSPGNYSFKVNNPLYPYNITPSSGIIYLKNQNLTQNVTFKKLHTYIVEFIALGYPNGDEWGVIINLNGVNKTYLSFFNIMSVNLANGSYHFYVIVFDKWVSVNPVSAIITINGANTMENITFTPLYEIKFVETGLSSGIEWEVNLNSTVLNSTSNTITFLYLPNGSYPFKIIVFNRSYAPNVRNGDITIHGSNVTQNIEFIKLITYSITFNESGLASGIEWSIRLSNSTLVLWENSTNSYNKFLYLMNGTYYYNVFILNNKWYLINHESGEITINGVNVTQNIEFMKIYIISFKEFGLISGIEWSVRLSNSTSILWENLTGEYDNFTVVNGSYYYNIYALNKWYSINQSSGNIIINGNNITHNIIFTKLYAIIFIENGLIPNTQWSLYLNSNYYTSNNSEIIIPYLLPNNYTFIINNIQGYNLSIKYGNISLVNQNITQYINFTFHNIISITPNNQNNISTGDLQFNSQHFSFIIDESFIIYLIIFMSIIFIVFMGIASVIKRGK